MWNIWDPSVSTIECGYNLFVEHFAQTSMHSPDLTLYYINRPPPTYEGHRLHTYFPSLEVLFPSIQHHTSGNPTLASIELVREIDGIQAKIENLIGKTEKTIPIWTKKMHIV